MDFFTTNSAFFAPLLIIIGFFLLTRGSDWLVDGASAVAKKFGISPLVIGLTVVSFGTSMPELVVSVSSTLSGNSSIAVANVVGSNIFNILAILGICATIRPIRLQSSTVWKEIPFTMAGIVTLIFLAYGALINTYGLGFFGGVLNGSINEVTGSLGLAAGVILLIFFVVYIYYSFGIANSTKTDSDEENKDDNQIQIPQWKSILYILGGLIMLVIGGKFTVDGAVTFAQLLGVSDRIIGLTIVAVGTSLPELLTSISATRKGNDDIAIGNVVGSNILNIFGILGVSSLFGVLTVGAQEVTDMLVLAAITVLIFGLAFVNHKFRYGKIEGIIMLSIYVAYTTFLIVS